MTITLDGVIRFVHLLAACVWVGGMVSMMVVLPRLSALGLPGNDLRTASRAFRVVGFPSMLVAIATGIWKMAASDLDMSAALIAKISLSALALIVGLAQARTTPATRPSSAAWMRFWLVIAGIGLVAASVWL